MDATDLVAEARRIVAEARGGGLALGVLGGVGVAIRCPSALQAPLARRYGDIDLAVRHAQRHELEALMTRLGFEADRETNLLFGRDRLIFFDRRRGLHVDVMVDRLRMCHAVPFAFTREGDLSPACLLLTKLQVVEAADKDLVDIVALLVDCPPGAGADGIDVEWLCGVCARDWGLWRTATDVILRAVEFGRALQAFPAGDELSARGTALVSALDRAPKTLAWKARSVIGRRVQWFELPDLGEKKA